ncbi:MAG: LLM class F420-dependent oxidoreductase [Nitrososphaerales archaeon]
MKIGLFLPQVGEQATKENVVKLAKEAEKEGFDSLWVLERLLWPINPKVPYPVTPDGSLPTEYKTVLEPLDLLTFVAANTEKISLGTSVIDMLYHTPVVLGRRVATLDFLSQGRVLCGLGIGWSKDEYEVSNVPFEHRGARADEFIEALKRIWSNDVVEFDGKYYKIPSSVIGPKPIQKPHPPIYIGGFTKGAFARIAKYAQGWIGVVAGPLEYLEGAMNMLKEEIKKADKDPKKFKILVLTSPSVTDSGSGSKDTQRFPLTGTVEEIGGDLQRMKQMGVDDVIFNYNWNPEGRDVDKVIETTKKLAKYAR